MPARTPGGRAARHTYTKHRRERRGVHVAQRPDRPNESHSKTMTATRKAIADGLVADEASAPSLRM